MPKDPSKGFVASLADGPAFVVVDAVSGAVKKLRASVLSAAFAPSSHVGAGGAAHAAATTGAAGFMSPADKTKLDALIESGTWTPTVSGAVNCTVTVDATGYWQRVGDYYDFHVLFLVTATSAGLAKWDFTKPPSFPAGGTWAPTVGDVVCADSDGQSRVTRDTSILTAQYAARGTATQRAWAWMRARADA